MNPEEETQHQNQAQASDFAVFFDLEDTLIRTLSEIPPIIQAEKQKILGRYTN